MHWSLARKRMYEACPRRYKYHYFESLYAFDKDRDFFAKSLYARRHEKNLEEIFISVAQAIIPQIFCEGRRSLKVNDLLDLSCSRELMSFPEADREGLEDELYPRLGRTIESLMKLDEFSWLSPVQERMYCNEFLKFETDGVEVDIFVPLVWRVKGELNVLRVQYNSSRVDEEAGALEALAFNKLFGQVPEEIVFWNLLIQGDVCVIRQTKFDVSVLFDVREMIMQTRSLLNNSENDFPFTKDMALCQGCKYMSLCERYE
jgi:hypothetical protein